MSNILHVHNMVKDLCTQFVKDYNLQTELQIAHINALSRGLTPSRQELLTWERYIDLEAQIKSMVDIIGKNFNIMYDYDKVIEPTEIDVETGKPFKSIYFTVECERRKVFSMGFKRIYGLREHSYVTNNRTI